MKKILLSIALAIAAPFAWAQVSETTTTTTTTEGSGTITEYTPGSVIVLKESSGPRTYHFGNTVTYVTRSGKVLDEDVVRTRVKVGVPVRVHYVGTGDNVMVDRVILDELREEDKSSIVWQRAFPVSSLSNRKGASCVRFQDNRNAACYLTYALDHITTSKVP